MSATTKNILLKVEYDGTRYFGWQIQNRKDRKIKTVQGELEKALKKLFGKGIRVNYAGRTDRGVHAKEQVVNFFVDTDIPLKNIKNALNGFLPEDIRIKKIKKVPLSFHARFSAKSKVYRYLILNTKDKIVFYRNYTWFIPEKLNIESMKKASSFLIGYKDFSVFTKMPHVYKSCLRRIRRIEIKKHGRLIFIDIEADGFLRNMARNIVSFLVDVGRGKINIDEAKEIINKVRPYVKKPAPPCGLYLYRVNYE